MLKRVRSIHLNQMDCLLITILFLLIVNGLYCFSFSDSRAVLGIASLTITFIAIVYIIFQTLCAKDKMNTTTLFLTCLIGSGIFYLFVFAPFTVPDEIYHFQASYKLADTILFQFPSSDNLPMRADDASILSALTTSVSLDASQYQLTFSNFAWFASDTSYIPTTPMSTFNFGQNPPQLKLASALGIVISQLLGLGAIPLFYAGRLFNFFFFLILAYFAVKITPVGKTVIMAVSLLPMTLHLVSSYSYDAGIIGIALFFSACCLKAIYGSGPISRKLMFLILISALMLAPCKVLYVLLTFAVILIPTQRFTSAKQKALFSITVIVGSLIMILLLRLPALINMTGVETTSASGTEITDATSIATYTLSGLLSDPLNTVLLFVRTLDIQGDFYLISLIGGSLGWFQGSIQAPVYVSLSFLLILFISFFKTPNDDRDIPTLHKIIYCSIGIIGLLAIMLSLALDHTPDTETVIQGVQGRYLLPFILFLAMAFRLKGIFIQYNLEKFIPYILLAMNAAYMLRVFAKAVNL